MTAILAGGHILIEDVPGVGKTTLALAFSKALHLEQNRIQFTPDVLPGDVTGFSLYQKATGTFEYQPGAVMCNLLLADEINRTSPKTQAALLEVMEEGKVTVDQITHSAQTVCGYCNSESGGKCGNIHASPVTAGSFYDLYAHRISGYEI